MFGTQEQGKKTVLKNKFKLNQVWLGVVALLITSLLLVACGNTTQVPTATPAPEIKTTPTTAPATTQPSTATPTVQPTATQPPATATATQPPATATATTPPATSTPAVVEYNPVVWFSSTSLKIGDTLTVGGRGYPANTKLNIALGFGGIAPAGNYANPTTDVKGQFSTKLKFDPAQMSDLKTGRVVVVVQVPGQEIAAGAPVTLEDNQPTATATPAKTPTVTAPTNTGKWIDVNLTKQKLTAYEGNKVVFTTLISSGVAKYPTVTGTFQTYIKYEKQRMIGGRGSDAYDLPNVPYVMYFYQDYAIHGAYWHNNFGYPMSHGCVNTPVDASRFLYNWAPVGTTVSVHF